MLFMKTQKAPNEKEIALMQMVEARDEYERALDMFNYAIDEYFDIANMELTIAKLRYDICVKKVRLLCKDGKDLPRMACIESFFPY